MLIISPLIPFNTEEFEIGTTYLPLDIKRKVTKSVFKKDVKTQLTEKMRQNAQADCIFTKLMFQ